MQLSVPTASCMGQLYKRVKGTLHVQCHRDSSKHSNVSKPSALLSSAVIHLSQTLAPALTKAMGLWTAHSCRMPCNSNRLHPCEERSYSLW